MGTAEEFFHVFGVAAGLFEVVLDAIFDFDGADGAEGTFVTEDEIYGLMINKAVGGVAVLDTDFVAKEGRKGDVGDDVEFGAKEVVEHLETLFLGADHEVFTGAIFVMADTLALAAAVGDTDKHRDQK